MYFPDARDHGIVPGDRDYDVYLPGVIFSIAVKAVILASQCASGGARSGAVVAAEMLQWCSQWLRGVVVAFVFLRWTPPWPRNAPVVFVVQ